MSLSVCFLTRNEEQNIARAIRSVTGLADEVLVADTGSTDQTVQIASEEGARIIQVRWQDDFAAGRNRALEEATGQWILWLNPDEQLLDEGRQLLLRAIEARNALAFALPIRTLFQPDRPEHYSETSQFRLFRAVPDLRYVGRAHPRFTMPLEELAHRRGQTIGVCSAPIRHHGYLSKPTSDKLRWAARLLKAELRDRPGQLDYLIEYGLTLSQLDDAKAQEPLSQAIELVMAARDAAQASSPSVQRLLELRLTSTPANSALARLPLADAEELALRWFPTSPPILWALASRRFAAGQFAESARLLEQLVRLGETRAYDKTQPFDPSIVDESARMNLGACYTRLRQLDQAEACFRALLGAGGTMERAAQQALAVVQNLRIESGQRPAGSWFSFTSGSDIP
jgi:hypothetical protein